MDYQPLEIADFSGGITDNVHSARPNQYYAADNLLVTPNAKLLQRDGSTLYSQTAYRLPNAERVGRIFKFNNTDTFFFVAKENLYYDSGSSFIELLGPTLNTAFPGATDDVVTTYGELNGHVYLTQDEGALPVKIYKDGSGNFQLRTTGLPAIEETVNYTEATVLSAASALANDIRLKMISHLEDYGVTSQSGITSGTPGIQLTDFLSIDQTNIFVGMYAFAFNVATGSSVLPANTTVASISSTQVILSANFTASGNTNIYLNKNNAQYPEHRAPDTSSEALIGVASTATLTSVATLTKSLMRAYKKHITDARLSSSGSDLPKYHVLNDAGGTGLLSAGGPNILLSTDVYPTTISEVSAVLDELKRIYNWHASALYTHTNQNVLGTVRYTSSQADVGYVDTGIRITPNLTELLNYANTLKTQVEGHVDDQILHFGYAPSQLSGASTATDFYSLVLLTYYVGDFYRRHELNAHIAQTSAKTGDITNGSAVITNLNNITGITAGMYVQTVGIQKFPFGTTVVSTTATTATMSAVATGVTGTTLAMVFSTNVHDAVSAETDEALSVSSLFLNLETLSNNASRLEAIGDLLNKHDSDPNIHKAEVTVYRDGDSSNRHLFNEVRPTVGSFLYAFHRTDSYTVGTLSFVKKGPVTFKGDGTDYIETIVSQDNPIAISLIPTLSNGTTKNYATSTITVDVYRTDSLGSNYYKVASVLNGTTTYSDMTLDTDLVTGELLYTTGGIVDNDPPPVQARTLHVTNGFTYYGDITDSGERFKYRVRQALQFNPDSAPSDFFTDLPDNIVGISSFRSIPVVFCETSLYRLSGSFDERGQGVMNYEAINDRIGCLSLGSIQQTREGIVFAGTDGFYFTDGYQCLRISTEFDTRYRQITSTSAKCRKITSSFDGEENRVWWGVQESDTVTDSDKCYILDLTYGVKADAVFTTASGGESFSPTALAFDHGDMIRGHVRGFVFKHSSLLKTDLKVDENVTPTLWGKQTLIYRYISTQLDMGTIFVRKWGIWIVTQCKDEGRLSLQIISRNDESDYEKFLKPIRARSDLLWGDPATVWGTTTTVWGDEGGKVFDQKRRFPAGGLRFTYKQIEMTNAYVVIDNSDNLGLATVSQAGKTATLVNAATFDWAPDAVDYYLSFENDDYTEEYKVTAQTANTLTFSDPDSLAPVNGNYAWELKGYPKDEALHLYSYAIHYQFLSKSQKPYQATASDTGANA